MKCTTLQVLFHEHNHDIILLCSMCGVSLINGLEYWIEQWNRKWNVEWWMRTITANSCNWRRLVNIETTYWMSRVLFSPQRQYEQVQCCQHTSLSGILMSWSENGASLLRIPGPILSNWWLQTSYSTMPHLLMSRKAANKVVRSRSDQGSRCTDEDCSQETEGWALISAITFLPKATSIIVVSDLCESLALQDYDN